MTALLTRARARALGSFDDAGVLAAADVHVARRLGALAGETDERVLLAVALVVRGTRQRLGRARPRRRRGDRSPPDVDDR